MSLESLEAQKKELQDDRTKLENLKSALSALYEDTISLSETLKETSKSIAKAGEINGKPFDGGHTEEYAIGIETSGKSMDNAINLINTDINKINQDISDINYQISEEKRRLSAASQPEANKKTNNNRQNRKPKSGYMSLVE